MDTPTTSRLQYRYSARQIAEAAGCSKTTVMRHAACMPVRMVGQTRVFTAKERAKILAAVKPVGNPLMGPKQPRTYGKKKSD